MAFFRWLFVMIDGVVFNLIGTAYDLIFSLSRLIFDNEIAVSIMRNLYVIVGVFALFRIALLLVNALIDPDKLNEKGKGLSNILVRTVIMLVLLVLTPILFQEAYELQASIIGKADDPNSGRIIEKIILGDKAATVSGGSVSDQFKSIAISALINVNQKFTKCVDKDNNPIDLGDGETCSGKNGTYLVVPTEENGWKGGYFADDNTCASNSCLKAIEVYNQMYVDGKMDIKKLSEYIATSERIENDEGVKVKEWVYDYSILLTTIVGGFIVYMMLSFALDIAARFFELAALEILAPLFIVSFIDPKSASSGMFNRWLKQVGTTYAGLFIRIAVLSLLLLFTSILSSIPIQDVVVNDDGAWVKLALFLGALFFAKKMPKWFSDMIGLKGDGGIGNIGLGKKIAEGALGFGMLAKGAKGIAGMGIAAGGNLLALARNRRQARKKIEKDNPDLSRKNRRQARKDAARIARGGYAPSIFADRDARRQARKAQREAVSNLRKEQRAALNAAKDASDFKYGGGQTAGRIANALLNGALTFNAAAKAEKLSGVFQVARKESKNFTTAKGLQGDAWTTKVGDWYDKRKSSFNESLYGNAQARLTRADEEKDRRNFERSFKDVSGLPEGFEIAKQTHYDAYTRVQDANGVWHYGADHDERLAMIGMAMAGVKTSDIILDESNRIVGIKGKDGEEDKKVSRDDVKNYATSATSQMPDYGLAQFQKYSADLESRLVNEYGSRTGDLNDLQAKLSNVASSIATATSRALNGVFDKLKGGFNIPIDVNASNLNAKISEINADISRLSSISNPSSEVTAQLDAQRATLAELQGLSAAMTDASSKSNGITYKDGNIVINGEVMSPERFRDYVKNDVNLTGDQRDVLLQTQEFHISAAQAQQEMVQTQRHIEALNSTCEHVGIMVNPVTGMQDNNKVIDGTYSQKVEIKVKKANDKYNAAFQAEKEKGNIKEGDA